jgi:microcystin-dependent protein
MRPSITASALRVALTALLPCLPFAAHAGPVTGSGLPITTEQPSVGINYIVRTSDPTNPANLGQIALFAGNLLPGGWAFADGQTLSISANQALFSAIGTRYGGNGVTTFALPNLMDRTAVGAGNGAALVPQPLGNASGSFSQTLNVKQLPPFGGAGAPAGTNPCRSYSHPRQ